jgi:hypothetical protein
MQERRRGRTTPANSTAALVGWAGFGRGPRREVAARLRKEMLFFFLFFNHIAQRCHFEQVQSIFKA